MAALGEWDPISLWVPWVGLSLCQIRKRTDGAWRHWHALDENKSKHSSFRNLFSWHPGAALNILQGLSLEMWREVNPMYRLA